MLLYLAVGQGDAHVIECKTATERDYAIVDMGTSSIKDERTLDRIKEIVGTNVVSNIFLTHPDEDHYNYLKNFKDKMKAHFHLGGDLDLWKEGKMSGRAAFNDIIAPLIFDQSVENQKDVGYSEYTENTFTKFLNGKRRIKRTSKEVNFCNKKMNMEIFVGGYTTK